MSLCESVFVRVSVPGVRFRDAAVPPADSPRAALPVPGWLKWLLGCAAGAFLLVFACCAGTCLMGRNFAGKVENAEAE